MKMKILTGLVCTMVLLVSVTVGQTGRELADMIISTDRNLRRELDWLRKDLKQERSDRQALHEKLNETVAALSRKSGDETDVSVSDIPVNKPGGTSGVVEDGFGKFKSELVRLKRGLQEEKDARKSETAMLVSGLRTAIQGQDELVNRVLLTVERIQQEVGAVAQGVQGVTREIADMKEEVNNQFAELEQDVKDMKQELKDLKQEVKDVKEEVKQEIVDVEQEVKQEVRDMKEEVKQEVLNVKLEVVQQGLIVNSNVTSIMSAFAGQQSNATDLQVVQSTQITESLQTLIKKVDLAGFYPSEMPKVCSVTRASSCTTAACCLDVYFTGLGQDAGFVYGFDDIRLTELQHGRAVSGGSHGRLEVLHDGEWGTVCNDIFDVNNIAATLVCKVFGYRTGVMGRRDGAEWTTSPDRIWLDEVICTDKTTSFFQCYHNPWGSNDCSHSEDVGVICSY